MTDSLVYVLLVAHFIGDFVCQSDWMAGHKSKQWDALGLHVAVYFSVLSVAVTATIWTRPLPAPVFLFLAANAAAHFIQDDITSRINARLWSANQRHWFFVGIGADQLLHYITLFITAGWWLQ